MSDDTTTEQSPATTGEKWGDQIDETRKQELWSRLRAWWDEADHGERKGPFAEERLTGAEVFWLAVCALARQEGTEPEQAERHLRTARVGMFAGYHPSLSLLALGEADLYEVQLQGANLDELAFPLGDLHRMDAKLARQLVERLLPFDRFQRHLRFERTTMPPTRRACSGCSLGLGSRTSLFFPSKLLLL